MFTNPTRHNIYAFNDIIEAMNDDEVIMRRIVDLAQIELEWKDVEPIYGKEATKILKELAPADPLLLHDMMVFSHQTDGKSEKQIEKLLEEYTHNDWLYDMKHFAKTIKRVKKVALADMKKA